jgi:two-component system chemotaxis response regulator CheB
MGRNPSSPGIIGGVAVYSRALAQRLNELCAFPVKEAVANEPVEKGVAYIAPGGFQMAIRKNDRGARLQVGKALYPSCYEPSADLLFESAAETFGGRAIGIILTGMGSDGAHGLLKLRQAGAHTVAQDQKTCVVFGMPRVAIELGAAEVVSPLEKISDHLLQWLAPIRKAA